ncbi:MAG: winged helix DNA-binding domain-containing protein, partial [Candidatus Eremiobacteraeota bacterium]|nr:winged helix DNA-binding domain-containing protein [Candidatus Eremiobacteraeota bacterium]
MSDISMAEARRIALAAQGFYDAPPARVTRRSLVRVLDRIKILQIDSVNVLVRSHYMPMFSRLGPYPVTLFHEIAYGPQKRRELFEYWGHEASLMPLSMQPLFRWRMERAQRRVALGTRTSELLRVKPRYVESIVRRIERDGPKTASAFEGPRGTGTWWGWSDVKIALEYLFRCGRLTTAARTKSFERIYDIPERVLPENVI